ncbi:MAG TPA: porin family protein [Terricaulis sp.]|nr:porin family protein [Terricaulis sp.]
MKKLLVSAAVAALGMAAIPAVASAEPYVGLGYTHYDTDAGDLGGVTGRVGYNFNRHVGVEAEGTIEADDGDVELDRAYGAYVRGIIPIGERFEAFGRVGYNTSEFSTPLGDVDADGVAYGVGAQFNVTQRFGIRADYTRLEGDLETDTFGLGGVMKF